MGRLYTRKGDDGSTGLADGSRVRKDDQRVEAYGTIDELNAHLGLAAGLILPRADNAAFGTIHRQLLQIQAWLFAISAELADPASTVAHEKLTKEAEQRTSELESWIDEAAERVAPLTAFILPGGDPAAAGLHVCRAVCRRAERCVVALPPEVRAAPHALKYLNRLSDLLFAWARLANSLAGVGDTLWDSKGDRLR